MADHAPALPGLSPVAGKPVHVAFDGGRLTSDAGVLLLAEIIRFRALLIAAGYPDANDCDALRGLAPRTSFWRDAQLDTLRLALIQVAARVTERATRIKVALPSSYPDARSWSLLSRRALGLPP
jgi:hypothetical protein